MKTIYCSFVQLEAPFYSVVSPRHIIHIQGLKKFLCKLVICFEILCDMILQGALEQKRRTADAKDNSLKPHNQQLRIVTLNIISCTHKNRRKFLWFSSFLIWWKALRASATQALKLINTFIIAGIKDGPVHRQ